MKKATVNGIKADLRAANAEAAGYLSDLGELREHAKALQDHIAKLEAQLAAKQAALQGCDRLCSVLSKALEYYQQQGDLFHRMLTEYMETQKNGG